MTTETLPRYQYLEYLHADDNKKNFILDEELYFHIEKVPYGLGFLDKLRFKQTITRSIEGNLIKIFDIGSYLVLMHTRTKRSRRTDVLLMKKIDLLKKICSLSKCTGLWVVRDIAYSCIGLIDDIPIFVKAFNTLTDLNNSIDIMIQTVNEYYPTQDIYLFGLGKQDICSVDANIKEYMSKYMDTLRNDFGSFTNYCLMQQMNKAGHKKKGIALFGVSFGIFLTSIGLSYVNFIFNNKLNLIHEEILIFSNQKQLPSQNHYKALSSI